MTSSRLAEEKVSSSGLIGKNPRLGLFDPLRDTTGAFSATLFSTRALDLVIGHLDDANRSIIKLARTSKTTHKALYPAIKRVVVKVLKEFIKNDDLFRAERLLRAHPSLLLREDEGDPQGRAYSRIESTPYQDSLADPIAEEMRNLLEDCFPGKTREEKLACAALQAREFKDARFDDLRKKVPQIMEGTVFAYKTHREKCQRWWERDDFNRRSAYDAWGRVGLWQDRWPKRLQKMFSVANKEKRPLDELKSDLPEPHSVADEVVEPWSAGLVGCDLALWKVPAQQVLFKDQLEKKLLDTGADRMLVQRGAGRAATYYLYAPIIHLDVDKVEWNLLEIDDPKVIQLIQTIDFSKRRHAYSPHFKELYQFGCARGFHLGSGTEYVFSFYNSGKGASRAGGGALDMLDDGSCSSNAEAVTMLFATRMLRLTAHLRDLERYLPKEPSPQNNK